MPKFDLKRKENRAGLVRAFGRANERLEQGFNYELASPKWAWPRTTVRSSGRVVSSPRDVRDTGALIDSYARRKVGALGFEHGWNVDYAAAVHEGARLRGGVQLPSRRWTEEPLEHLEKAFADEVGK